ncbi:HNH endonuclease [Stratiformator vulcanicus]|uniref:HNH endonuclease n=1 Tax=Stratiformator vulcanicus TaxID=2527980 RepID=A0A517R5P9_9PLAN|nr:HNH endonuclease signature motif containing protein [Stratiformator vulcanicus]QDT39153.1 HNH endonuclease [Stratiformator vulcanicus]
MNLPAAIRQQVVERANQQCEYCGIPQEQTIAPHEVDHIRSLKHGGRSETENLCLACFYCNSFKGSDIATIDPSTDELVRLFSPRLDRRDEHFRWEMTELVGRTPVRRGTVTLLQINLPERREHRRLLARFGAFPFSPRPSL